MSMMVSFVLSFFPRGVLDEILNLIESVSEVFFPTLREAVHQPDEIYVNCIICLVAMATKWLNLIGR